jgi:hypothetical protein
VIPGCIFTVSKNVFSIHDLNIRRLTSLQAHTEFFTFSFYKASIWSGRFHIFPSRLTSMDGGSISGGLHTWTEIHHQKSGLGVRFEIRVSNHKFRPFF